MIDHIPVGKFFFGWSPAFAVAAAIDAPRPLTDFGMLTLNGFEVPVVTCLLGALGVLIARPLARRGERELVWWEWTLVSLAMLVLVELWVLERKPGWLFAFVVAIGLGFSGYSLIELIGAQVKSGASRVLSSVTGALGAKRAQASDPTKDEQA